MSSSVSTSAPEAVGAGHHIDAHLRLSLSLVVSLVLWTPFGLAALRGELDPVAAGIRYLVAFVGTKVAVEGIAHLVATYRSLQAAADEVPVAAVDPDPVS